MATYTVSVAYLVPVVKEVTIEADNVDDACERAPEIANCSDGWAHDDEGMSPIYVTRAALVSGPDPERTESEIDFPARHGRERTLAGWEA